jgi:DnaJ-domain-containing protein 1
MRAIRKDILEKEFASTALYEGGFEEKMSKREAMLILGLKSLEDTTAIKNNYKRLLMGNHPDKGGSLYLAQKINEAKKVISEYAAID